MITIQCAELKRCCLKSLHFPSSLPSFLPSSAALIKKTKSHLSLELLSKQPIMLPWKPFTRRYILLSLCLHPYLVALLPSNSARCALLLSPQSLGRLDLCLILITDLSWTKATGARGANKRAEDFFLLWWIAVQHIQHIQNDEQIFW